MASRKIKTISCEKLCIFGKFITLTQTSASRQTDSWILGAGACQKSWRAPQLERGIGCIKWTTDQHDDNVTMLKMMLMLLLMLCVLADDDEAALLCPAGTCSASLCLCLSLGFMVMPSTWMMHQAWLLIPGIWQAAGQICAPAKIYRNKSKALVYRPSTMRCATKKSAQATKWISAPDK